MDDCIDLPALSVFDCSMAALRRAADVTLQNIPSLTELTLQFAFKDVKMLRMENASLLEMNYELMEKKKSVGTLLKEEEEKKRRETEMRERRERGIVLNAEDLQSLSVELKSVTVKACDDYHNEMLDLSRFSALEELEIGDECFNYVSKVSVVALPKLRSIVVGENSFTNEGVDTELVLRNCPALQELHIGNQSFFHFWSFKMEELPALETMQIGSKCFVNASLCVSGMNELHTVRLGEECFANSQHTVIQGDDWRCW